MAPSPAHRGVESNNHRPYRVRQLIQFGGHRAAFSLAHAHAHRLVLRVKLCLDCRLELYIHVATRGSTSIACQQLLRHDKGTSGQANSSARTEDDSQISRSNRSW